MAILATIEEAADYLVEGYWSARHSHGSNTSHWIGRHDFHDRKGELHYVKSGNHVVVEGDVNGDGHADFQINVLHLSKLSAGDFML